MIMRKCRQFVKVKFFLAPPSLAILLQASCVVPQWSHIIACLQLYIQNCPTSVDDDGLESYIKNSYSAADGSDGLILSTILILLQLPSRRPRLCNSFLLMRLVLLSQSISPAHCELYSVEIWCWLFLLIIISSASGVAEAAACRQKCGRTRE